MPTGHAPTLESAERSASDRGGMGVPPVSSSAGAAQPIEHTRAWQLGAGYRNPSPPLRALLDFRRALVARIDNLNLPREAWNDLFIALDDVQSHLSEHAVTTPLARQVADLELAAIACGAPVHRNGLARLSTASTPSIQATPEPRPSGRDAGVPLFPALVASELTDARIKHGNQRSLHEAYAVILEELDEFWDVVKRNGTNNAALSELVQVAAMCQRAAEDLRLFADDFPSD